MIWHPADTDGLRRWLYWLKVLLQGEAAWPTAPDAVPDLEEDDEVKKEATVNLISIEDAFDKFITFFGIFCAFTCGGLDAEVSALPDAEVFASWTRSSPGFAEGY